MNNSKVEQTGGRKIEFYYLFSCRKLRVQWRCVCMCVWRVKSRRFSMTRIEEKHMKGHSGLRLRLTSRLKAHIYKSTRMCLSVCRREGNEGCWHRRPGWRRSNSCHGNSWKLLQGGGREKNLGGVSEGMMSDTWRLYNLTNHPSLCGKFKSCCMVKT